MRGKVELKFVRIEKLRPHEATYPELVDTLVDDIKRRALIYPIIVDRETMVIIDGHHRVEAFKKLGFEKIPALLVDYRSLMITVNRWYYLVDLESRKWKVYSPEVDEVLVTFIRRVVRRLRPGNYEVLLMHWRYITRIFHDNLREVYWILHDATRDLPFKKIPEDQYRSEIPVIIPPPISKEYVLHVALDGKVFPPKSTRHIFHFPIPEVNYS